jgi:metacaspase-1
MNRYALCIGINDYPGKGNDLAGCVNDAHDWAAALKRRGFKVKTLLNRAATGRRMRDEIAALLGRARAKDLVVVQYSGHGSFVPDRDGDERDAVDECLCPWDVASQGPIVDDELAAIYGDRPRGVRLLMVSDSCHSGTVARFAPIRTPPTLASGSAPRRTVRFLPPLSFLSGRAAAGMQRRRRASASAPRFGGLLLAGCQDSEYSYDAWFRGRANGAFTFVALNALKRLPLSATYQRWFDAIRRLLPSRQYPQSPSLYGAAGVRGERVFA